MNDTDLGHNDLEFGSIEERQQMETKLLWKLDCRMSILIIIYILNYVCPLFNTVIENKEPSC